MSKAVHTKSEPFFLNGKRAMISIGALADKQHCSYRCAFCYVQDDFSSYAKLNVDEIIKFLKEKREYYEIIYVSGDTDSFAPPRTKKGLELLYRVAIEIDCDLLFTTRAVFSEGDYKMIHRIADEQKRTKNEFYACISITRYSDDVAYLEPDPIPTPNARIAILKRLKEIGVTTVLAMRPFLPVVNKNDYLTIIEKSKEFVDIVLGECFYFIRDGKIQNRVFPNGIPERIEKELLHNQKMEFDNNSSQWEVWDAKEYYEVIKKRCEELNIVFSMHSDDAIFEYLHRKEKN